MAYPRLIPNASIGGALAFGWRALGAVLYEKSWFYAVVLAVGVALTAWASSFVKFQPATVEWIAAIGALGAAARYARPSFRMTARSVWSVFAIDAISTVASIALLVGPIVLAFATHAYWIASASLLGFPLAVWIVVKLGCGTAFYVLHDENDAAILGAMRESWSFVSDGMWRTTAGVQLLSGIAFALVPAVASFVAWAILRGLQPLVVTVVTATIFYLVSIPANVWGQLSLVALASTKDGVA